ncbi:hypothetical protein Neosp_013739 [[Neocosmospora] mangrovei]
MTVDMNVSFDQLNWGVAFNSAGLAVGCFLFIPLSKKYGRRLTYVVSTGIMAACAWWSSQMSTPVEMYLTNFIFGLAGSTNEAISEMTAKQIADLFFINQRGTVNGFYVIAVMLGNFIAPTIAGVQAASQGWRWSYKTCAIVLTILFVLFTFFYEETKYIPISIGSTENVSVNQDSLEMLDKNSKPDAKTAQPAADLECNSSSATVPPPNSYRQRMRFLTKTEEPLWRNYTTPLKIGMFPHVLYTGIQCANCVLFLVLLSTINSIVFSRPPYNFNTAGVGLMLLGPFVGNLIGSIYGGLLGDWLIVRLARRNGGIFEPEMRLYILGLPALSMGAGLVVYGVTVDRGLHWIYPSIGGALFAFGVGSIMDVSCTIVIDTYQSVTAEAFVFITFVRNIACVGLPFGVVPWMNTMSLTKIFVISGCINTALALLFVPLMVWGRRIRVAMALKYEGLLAQVGGVNRA